PPFNAGFTVEHECRLGYWRIVPLVRPASTVSQPDNTWAPPPMYEICMRSSCPQLAEPSFPSSRARETIGHVTYHCCTWQNPLKLFLQFFHPRVVYKAFSKCFMPQSRLDGSFQFGSEAHCSCNEGYYFLGSPVLHCELSGNDAAWRDEPPRCGKILRQPPQQIPNGAFSNSHKDTFEYNEIVTSGQTVSQVSGLCQQRGASVILTTKKDLKKQ
ncbi:Membrane cofactor protein, partial [Myotis davidii]